jgi:dipeptide transport system permease protein
MGMRTYIIRRLLLLIPTLIGVTLLIFSVVQVLSPEQRAALYITSEQQADNIQEIIEKYHLRDPVYVQYFVWITQVLQGNLGYNQKSPRGQVLQNIMNRAPATIELTVLAAPVIILSGIFLGVASAVHRDRLVDHVSRIVSIIGWSFPSFWLGILLLAIFYAALGWAGPGRLSVDVDVFVRSAEFTRYTGLHTIDGLLNGQLWVTVDALKHLILPVLSLTVQSIALIVRVMRSSMLEALTKGYIVSARAKGLGQREVINKHARRNALIPVVTLAGMLSAGLLTGVVITETIFYIPGLGSYAAHMALSPPDIAGVLGFTLFTGVLFVLVNLIVDVAYAYIDPRIRLG